MSFDIPSADDLVGRFPAFNGVPSSALVVALAEAATRVDSTWTAGDYRLGLMLYAAHVLSLDGFGTGAEAALGAAGAFGFATFRSGSLHLERKGASDGRGSPTGLSETTYGRRFFALLKVNQPAVLVP